MKEEAEYYPVMLKIKDKTCVLIGGGKVAARKLEGLLHCNARVRIISPQIDCAIEKLIDNNNCIEWVNRNYTSGDLDGGDFVICATNRRDVNEQVYTDARKVGIPLNAADRPELSDFIIPAVVRRGSMQICISTGGKSPGLSKKVKEHLEEQFDNSYSELVEIMEAVRKWVLSNVKDEVVKQRMLKTVVDTYPDILRCLRSGTVKELAIDDIINRFKQGNY